MTADGSLLRTATGGRTVNGVDPLAETDIDELVETIVLAYGDDDPVGLRQQIEMVRQAAQENARKQHARLMRPQLIAEEIARSFAADLLQRHPPVCKLIWDLWEYVETHRLLALPNQWVQVAGLRITRAG